MREGGDFDSLITKEKDAAPQNNKAPRSAERCDPRCLSLCERIRFEALLHHDLLTRRIQRALHAHALSIELRNVGLMIDVINMARVIFQHILISSFHDRSRESLAVGSGCVRRSLRARLRSIWIRRL